MDSELKLTAEYIKNITTIEAGAKDERNGVAKLELFYKDKLLEDKTIKNPKDSEKWEVSGIGIGKYTVRATSNTGLWKERVIYVDNVSDKLTPPVISLNPASPNGDNDWYKTEVQVTITTDSPSAKEIRYRIVSGLETTPEEGAKYNEEFTISANGTVIISAWTTDGTYISDPKKCEKTIYIDTTKPTIVYPPRIIASKDPVNNWYKSGLEIEISGEDEHSKIAGYRYQIEGESKNWIDRKLNQKISIGETEREGTTKIAIKTFDNAGNESPSKTVTIQKDTGAPDTAKIEFKSNTANSITVSATGNDNVSGVASYTFEYKKSTDTTWQKLTNAEVKTELGRIDYEYTGIEAGEYLLRVIIKDRARNETPSQVLSATTVLNTPPRDLETWCSNKTTTSMTISAKAYDDDNPAQTLTYKLYWGDSTTAIDKKTGTSGETVIFETKEGLAEYTTQTYSWRVEVTDSKSTTISQNGSDRTKCSGRTLYCEGPTYVRCERWSREDRACPDHDTGNSYISEGMIETECKNCGTFFNKKISGARCSQCYKWLIFNWHVDPPRCPSCNTMDELWQPTEFVVCGVCKGTSKVITRECNCGYNHLEPSYYCTHSGSGVIH